MITKKFGNLLSTSPLTIPNNNNNHDNIQNDIFQLNPENNFNNITNEKKSNLNNLYNNINNNNNIFNFNFTNNTNINFEFNYNNSPVKLGTLSPNINFINNNNNNNSIINTQNNQKNLSKFEKMIQNTSELRNSTATLQTNPNQVSNTSIKWSNMVKKSKQEMLKLDLSQSEVLSSTNQLDFSAMSENMDDMDNLNDLIEENYQVVITENSFLRQESHSILPFLFLSSREIHRMCLSDYEVKLVNKSIKNKIKNNRLDWMDYYKKGLIKFYQAKYFDSYMNFKAAYNMRSKDKEVAKWLAFNVLIIVFCANVESGENSKFSLNDFTNSFLNFNLGGGESKGSFGFNNNNNNKGNFSNNNFGINSNLSNLNNNSSSNYFYGSFKIDFSKLDKINIKNEDQDYSRSTNINENISDEEDNALFSCCSSRKAKIKTLAVSALTNTYQAEREQNLKLNKSALCRELENILNELLNQLANEDLNFNKSENNKNNNNDYNNENNSDFLSKESAFKIEIWWMLMIISVYVKIKPEQKAFIKFYDPKHFVKKIKDKDVYLGYLAYAEYNSLFNKNFNPENIFVEIIYKFPKRIEGYLKFWSRLVKGAVKEYKKAHSLSEVFWKNSSIIQFDNDVY